MWSSTKTHKPEFVLKKYKLGKFEAIPPAKRILQRDFLTLYLFDILPRLKLVGFLVPKSPFGGCTKSSSAGLLLRYCEPYLQR